MKKLNLSALNAKAVKSTESKSTSILSEKDLEKALGGVSYSTAALHSNHYNYDCSGTVSLQRAGCN